jgi:hypothetical protein
MTSKTETPADSVLASYEAKLNQAGYLIFKYDSKWYYNEIEATDDLCDGPYSSRGEVLLSACRTLRLIDRAA